MNSHVFGSRPDLSSLKVSKEWDICWRLCKRQKCTLFLVRVGPKTSRGVRGYAVLENLLNSLRMHCRVRHLSFKPCLLGASMLLLSAWANTRNKKIDRTRTDWILAEVQCQWRNEFGIHEHFWKLKGWVIYQNSAKAWEMLASAWERVIVSKWVRLTLNAWDLRALVVMHLSFAPLWVDLKDTHGELFFMTNRNHSRPFGKGYKINDK